VLINAEMEGVEVPKQYIEGGKIIFNISPQAIQALEISNQVIEFDASFSGEAMHIFAPIKSIEAIYARENGRGMVFNQEEDEGEPPTSPTRQTKSGKPKLTVIK
jgi:stringent starvation protein B